jgi:hypothetical protein
VLRSHVEDHIVLKRVLEHCHGVFILNFTQDLALAEAFNTIDDRRLRDRK